MNDSNDATVNVMVTIPMDCVVIKIEERDNLIGQRDLLIRECVKWEKKFDELVEMCKAEAELNKTSLYRGTLYVDKLAKHFGFELPPVVKEGE